MPLAALTAAVVLHLAAVALHLVAVALVVVAVALVVVAALVVAAGSGMAAGLQMVGGALEVRVSSLLLPHSPKSPSGCLEAPSPPRR